MRDFAAHEQQPGRRLLRPTQVMRNVVAFALAVSLFASPAPGADMLSAAAQLIDRDRVLVVAHRGDSQTHPENTLSAFESAVRQGADLVELDYHHSRDGVPVVLHDFTLDRTTDARRHWEGQSLSVGRRLLEELRLLDAGGWFAPEFAGQRIPTLEESLDVIQNGSVTLIERKAGDASTCVEILRRKRLVEQVVVQSFDWNYVAECRRLEPRLVLAALGGNELTDERLQAAALTGAQIIAWHHKHLDAPAIARIHQCGLRAWCFTVDDPGRVEALITAGIDGVITNRPGQMRALVEQQFAGARPAE